MLPYMLMSVSVGAFFIVGDPCAMLAMVFISVLNMDALMGILQGKQDQVFCVDFLG